MRALAEKAVLRPAPLAGVKSVLADWALGHFDVFTRVLRRTWPIPHGFGVTAVLRFDDVVEVFANDRAFPVDYDGKLSVIMDHRFFLGMGNTPEYRRDTDMLRRAVLPSDIPHLARRTRELGQELVEAGDGRIEVVQMVRDITFGVLAPYFGVTAPEGEDLQVWATRLFEFQFTDPGGDPALRAEVDQIAPRLRSHVDALIRARKRDGHFGDDVLGRCLALQAEGVPGSDDAGIRTALLGAVVGGPPQPPMVVPQALAQLLLRPADLAAAQAAARTRDEATLAGYVTEAMRFDPLAPGLFRRVAFDTTIAAGTPRATKVQAGTKVFVAFRSAMQDPVFVPDPQRFDPTRPADQYIHFGHGLHTCFGAHINRALLPLMLEPLLARPNLRAAPGREGRLLKRGAFADRLVIHYS